MSTKDAIVNLLLTTGRPLCDDCIAEATGISPRQQINSQARKLETEGKLTRGYSQCDRCGRSKRTNSLRHERPASPSQTTEGHRISLVVESVPPAERGSWPEVSNFEKGEAFKIGVSRTLEHRLGVRFDMEVGIPIGSPPKLHKYDLVSENRAFVGECKALTWTAAGNVPSAKITNLREAVQLLRLLPSAAKPFLAMKRSVHPKNGQSLADYFVRLNRYLVRELAILEFEESFVSFRVANGVFP